MTFQGHQGRVNDLVFSPFEHNLFLSCGSDQQIRIYSLIYPFSPVHIIPLDETSASCLAWSWSRPLVFAAGCQNHKLMIFDLRSAKELSKATSTPLELKASEKLIPFPLTSVSYNVRNYGLIATGDGFVDYVLDYVQNKFADCSPLANVYDLTENTICYQFLNPFNGIWTGVGLYLILMLPILILACALEPLFRRYHKPAYTKERHIEMTGTLTNCLHKKSENKIHFLWQI